MRIPAILPLVVINAGNKQLQNILNVLSIGETYSPSTNSGLQHTFTLNIFHCQAII
jgi:hypothetical protein